MLTIQLDARINGGCHVEALNGYIGEGEKAYVKKENGSIILKYADKTFELCRGGRVYCNMQDSDEFGFSQANKKLKVWNGGKPNLLYLDLSGRRQKLVQGEFHTVDNPNRLDLFFGEKPTSQVYLLTIKSSAP